MRIIKCNKCNSQLLITASWIGRLGHENVMTFCRKCKENKSLLIVGKNDPNLDRFIELAKELDKWSR